MIAQSLISIYIKVKMIMELCKVFNLTHRYYTYYTAHTSGFAQIYGFLTGNYHAIKSFVREILRSFLMYVLLIQLDACRTKEIIKIITIMKA